MRIFYASDTTPNSSFASNLWRHNLLLPLVDLGHEVVEFDYDLRATFQNLDVTAPLQQAFINRNRPKLSKELVQQIKRAHRVKPVDMFFSYFYSACVLPETIDEIKSMGITTVNWYCNGSYQLHLVAEIAPHYHWCLVPEQFRLDEYRALGARPLYCQEAANPHIYHPYEVPREFDVTFVGQAYGDRPSYTYYLCSRGIDIKVWGLGWDAYSDRPQEVRKENLLARAIRVSSSLRSGEGRRAFVENLKRLVLPPEPAASAPRPPPLSLPASMIGEGVLSDQEMIRMYSRSKINLGFSSCGDTHETERILQVRLRDFEVPMSGGFYMVEYMKELEAFYDIGKEIVCYVDKEDLVDKINYYLKNETERERIRSAGRERCLRDHTWHKRFQAAFEEMGLA
jgi:spore maturation protein CgeB